MALTKVQKEGIETLINNNADNRVITGSGTANTLNAESGVVIDSSGRLLVGTTTDNGFKFKVSDSGGFEFAFAPNDSGVNNLVNYNRSGSAYVPFQISGSDLRFASGGNTERMRIDSSGNVMIGITSSGVPFQINATASAFGGQNTVGVFGDTTSFATGVGGGITLSGRYNSSSSQVGFGAIRGIKENGTDGNYDGALTFSTRPNQGSLTERMRIDSSGNVGIGVTPTMATGGGLHIRGPNGSQSRLHLTTNRSGDGTGDGFYIIQQGDESSNNETNFINYETASMKFSTSGTERMRIHSTGNVGIGTTSPGRTLDVNGIIRSDGTSSAFAIGGNSSTPSEGVAIHRPATHTMAFVTDSTERLRIDSSGNIVPADSLNVLSTLRTQGQTFVKLTGHSTSNFSVMVFGVNSGGHNTGSCAVALGKHSNNSRSLNAAGTVNASGNDYAEYMTKSGDFTIAKGDICGINANGKLTNKFSESISFVVKSTDPSYVGGDAWGTEEILGEKPADDSDDLVAYEEKYEAARKMVDRIAFSGQVPVNVTGATAGQYIIPTVGDGDSITGVAKTEKDLSMTEYMSSIGKVIALESDGRAKIIVKIA